jgi:TDG/mug DNA glycosylase family protein
MERACEGAFREPRNDFWRLLHAARFTPRVLEPQEADQLVPLGLGLTNAARRTTRGSGDLRKADFAGAAGCLEEIARTYRPEVLAFVGKAAFQGTFGGRRAEHGLQERKFDGTALFVLPSTSPANAAVSWDERLRWFRALRELVA